MIVIPMLDHTTEEEAFELAVEIQQVFQFHFGPKVVIKVPEEDYQLYCETI